MSNSGTDGIHFSDLKERLNTLVTLRSLSLITGFCNILEDPISGIGIC